MIKYRRDLWKVVKVPGDAAEIGVAEGYFSAEILSWSNNFPRVYMVDRWCCASQVKGDSSNPQSWHDKNYKEAMERVGKFASRAVFLRGDSHEMSQLVPNESLAFLNIDGDHSYEGVTRDLVFWRSKMVPGGVIAFHDYEAPQYGVKSAVLEFAFTYGHRVHLLPEDKPDDAGAYIVV